MSVNAKICNPGSSPAELNVGELQVEKYSLLLSAPERNWFGDGCGSIDYDSTYTSASPRWADGQYV